MRYRVLFVRYAWNPSTEPLQPLRRCSAAEALCHDSFRPCNSRDARMVSPPLSSALHFGSPRRSSLLIDLAVLSASEPSQSSSSSDEEDGCEGAGAESTARSITGDGLLGVPSGVEDARSGLQPVLRANAAAFWLYLDSSPRRRAPRTWRGRTA